MERTFREGFLLGFYRFYALYTDFTMKMIKTEQNL